MTARACAALGAALLCLALAAPARAQDGVQHLKFSYGPIAIAPGHNTIELERNDQRPAVDGWIVGFRPNLVRKDGSVPRVDVIHLHHGVWLNQFGPLFAAGEEKTAAIAPPGHGWRYRTTDGAPAAQGIQEIRTAWLDTVGGFYPVFDASGGRAAGTGA